MHPAYASLHYLNHLQSMVSAPPSCFPSISAIQRAAAERIIFALLASDTSPTHAAQPPEAEGGRVRSPPQRDKQEKFNLGASLREQDQLRVLAMLNANTDRFAFSMEDLEPTKYSGEPMRLELNSDKPIFRPPHKLGQVELDFVEAHCSKLEKLGFIRRSP